MSTTVDIYYDFEFIENGSTIVPISVGMFRPDIGQEYYAANSDIYTDEDLRHRIESHKWLMENVVPHLPVTAVPRYRAGENHAKWGWLLLDTDSRLVKPAWVIRNELIAFTEVSDGSRVRLNGWYAAYNHVCLMQFWGPMIRKPGHLPMWTRDLKQEADRLGNPDVPEQAGTAHNALDDAKHAWEIDDYLAHYEWSYSQGRQCPADCRWDHAPGEPKPVLDPGCPQHPGQLGDH